MPENNAGMAFCKHEKFQMSAVGINFFAICNNL